MYNQGTKQSTVLIIFLINLSLCASLTPLTHRKHHYEQFVWQFF